MALLQPGVELPSDLLKAVLKVLSGLAHDELSCEAIQQASGIPRIIKLLEYAKDDQVRPQSLLSKYATDVMPINDSQDAPINHCQDAAHHVKVLDPNRDFTELSLQPRQAALVNVA